MTDNPETDEPTTGADLITCVSEVNDTMCMGPDAPVLRTQAEAWSIFVERWLAYNRGVEITRLAPSQIVCTSQYVGGSISLTLTGSVEVMAPLYFLACAYFALGGGRQIAHLTEEGPSSWMYSRMGIQAACEARDAENVFRATDAILEEGLTALARLRTRLALVAAAGRTTEASDLTMPIGDLAAMTLPFLVALGVDMLPELTELDEKITSALAAHEAKRAAARAAEAAIEATYHSA